MCGNCFHNLFMNKIYLLLIILFSSSYVSAYDFEKNGIYYTIIDDALRTVEVSKSPNNDYSGSVSIPKIVKPDNSAISYIVTGIGGSAFKQCTNLTSIELPTSIENISWYAFEDCINLTRFTFPESITYIGHSAFKNCRNLRTVYFNAISARSPKCISYGRPSSVIFENCLNLSSVYIGNNVEKIPSTFFATIPVSNIFFPKSLKVIEEGAFMECTSLSTISFDSDCMLTSVGDYAFSYCKALNDFYLPNSVLSIGDYAFQYCEKFSNFPFSPDSEITNFGTYAFSCCRGVTELYLPSKVTNLNIGAFEDCRNLKYIYFPETILNIGKGAFDAIWDLPNIYCTSLTPPIVKKINSLSGDVEQIFSNLDKSKCTLHVPAEAQTEYQLTEPWNQFPNIVTGISPASISIEESSLTLYVGDIYKFNPILFPWFTQDCEISYSSSNNNVAEVDNNGTIHALKDGTTSITISAGRCNVKANVTVKSIYPSSVKLNVTSKDVFIEDEFDLIATIYPDNVTDKSLKWESTDENVCIVDQTGHVTARGVGSCWVIAYCQSKSGLCKVNVKPIEVESISISKNEPTLGGYIGNTITLDVLVLPANATDKTLTWSIEDPSIASVDENGVVTFLAVGYTKVRASASNGVFSERDLIVYSRLPQTFSISPENVSLNVGESFTFIVSMTPDNIDDRTVVWHSSEPDKVAIDENGTVIALAPDCLVKIWGVAANGLESSAYVEVKPIQAEEIILSSDNITFHLLVDGGLTYTDVLTATVLPETTTNKTITWTSSDESVAYYNDFFDWHIAVGNPGTAVITATASNGKSASCLVTVIQDEASVIDITTDKQTPTVLSQNGCIMITGADISSDAYIYDTAGNLIYSGSKREIPIDEKGVYIVVVGQKHFKIAVI